MQERWQAIGDHDIVRVLDLNADPVIVAAMHLTTIIERVQLHWHRTKGPKRYMQWHPIATTYPNNRFCYWAPRERRQERRPDGCG